MSEMSAAEAEVVARFDAAEPAPESWRGDDVLRDRLADALEEALAAAYHYSSYRWPQQQDCPRIADALLPVVTTYAEQRARERAAEELRAAADVLDGYGAYLLQVRADALAADDRTGQR